MIEKFVDYLVEKQVCLGIIQDINISIYRYGYVLMLEGSINIFISILLGLLLGKIKNCLLFFLFFVPLRSFCGGYHAKKTWQCVVLSNLVLMSAVIMSNWILQFDFSLRFYILGIILLGSVIFCFSPIDDRNKRLNDSEKKFIRDMFSLF